MNKMVGTALLCATGKAVHVDRAHSPSKTGVKRPEGPPYKLSHEFLETAWHPRDLLSGKFRVLRVLP